MIAYTTGSGNILCSLLGLPNWAGSVLFTVPCVLVVWLGLKATGLWEKFVSSGMVVLLFVIIAASFLSGKADPSRVMYANWLYAVPLLSSAIFCYIAQYAVPELARGMRHTPKKLPVAIMLGMFLTGVLLAVVPFAVLSLTGAEKVTQVATLAWGEALGTWALYTANIFALCAMMTSYWAVGGSMLTNIVDMFKLKDEHHTATRLVALLCTVVPPFVLAYAGLVSFVDAIGWAGTFGGVIMSIIPVMMLNSARKNGDIEPEWKCGWYAHPAVQGTIIVIFGATAVYYVCSMVGILPAGW
ncbi:MAG: aromatic amino acid transport family protein, partial [Pyramidobacter sp.]|nr:aromatic amino acid transport family protein [Pyramidobacter sp.]